MGGPSQFEIQLGHLCNNRCVFCISGALTSQGQAPLLPGDGLAQSIRDAHAAGHRRITFLGGEPTIQPVFLDLVRLAVELGFESIVIFTNGSKPGRTDLIDRVLATGGNFEWRFSFQGATREAHERTTRRRGSWDQLVRSVRRARARGQRATVNMCVVAQNYESLPHFAALLVPLGVGQLHVDMLNPYDVGIMSEERLTEIMPRYTDLAAPLERMVGAFPEGFDVNVGNLPYCVAPALAPWIHHGGQPTWTVTANDFGAGALQAKRNKYLVKSDHKLKPERCRTCVFDDRCSGVFDAYVARFGTDELAPVTPERLVALDPGRRLVALHLRAALRAALADLAPWVARASVDEANVRELTVTLASRDERVLRLAIGPSRRDADAACDWFGVRVLERTVEADEALGALRVLWSRLMAPGTRSVYAPGEDAVAALHPAVAARVARLRAAAPFGALDWADTRVQDEGARAEIVLRSPAGEDATVWLALRGTAVAGGYRVGPMEGPSQAVIDGLREVMEALGRGGARPAAAAPRA